MVVPEYNFYSNVLQLKQGKYDAAREQLSTLYGSLLNAPITRDDNAQTRDQFFKAIDQDIQRMSGVDLSLNQNFESAQGVFNQLLDNKYIVKDMVWGDKISSENVRSVRPGFGLSPRVFDEIKGKRIKMNIKAGTALTWDMLL